ncbi:MAG: hypothetical protein EHM33_23415 [Chloroflexi bacterium]|nr:MAG: hypothetical protein EHM33_23415 [Chloroflexota bacterium]
MANSTIITIIIVLAVIMLVIWGLTVLSARRVNLTRRADDQKPNWIRTDPPLETIAATQADGEGVTLYDHDPGERVAAPFAEQIEDMLRAQMSSDPYLQSYEIDFGTGPDGGLEIIVGDKRYTSIEQIPDERLRAAISQAVATYNQREDSKR